MSLAWLFPLGLAAVAAWLVPLLLHLRRRSEQQRTPFAALQWLPARSRPRTRLRFEEWPLLLVRLLLLAVLAVLLAQPMLFGSPHAKRWVLVAPGVDSAAAGAREKDTEYRWLAPGFPELDAPAPPPHQPVGSLLRELDATLPADVRITAYVPEILDGADAVRPALGRPIGWHLIRVDDLGRGSPIKPAPRPVLAVRHDDGNTEAVRFLRAAAIAWRANTNGESASTPESAADIGSLGAPLPSINTPLVWLASTALPAQVTTWIDRGGTALVGAGIEVPDMARRGVPLWRDDDGNVLVRGLRHGRGRVLQWSRALQPDAMPGLLQPEFPERLWQLFAPPGPAPARIAASDYAPVTGARMWPEIPLDLAPWLMWLIAVLFVVERWLASGRRDGERA